MKKLIAIVMMLLPMLTATSTHAADTMFLGRILNVPVQSIQSHIDSNLTTFAQTIGATKAKAQINKNLPNLLIVENEPVRCCELEVEFQFKATTVEQGYALMRSMLCTRYGKYEPAVPIRTLGKNSLMWFNGGDQIMLYMLGEKVYLDFYLGNNITATFGF